MGTIEIIFSGQFIFATLVYGLLIIIGLFILEYIRSKLEHDLLMGLWGKVSIPLFRAFLIGLFVYISYPIIFGLEDAPSITTLINAEEGRINSIINILFLISLFFPFIPILGKHIELILPLQAIACCIMVFSWLAEANQLTEYTYWPGILIVVAILLIAVFTHWLANHLAGGLGQVLDQKFHVDGSNELVARAIILFMQAPAIVLYSSALGSQLIVHSPA